MDTLVELLLSLILALTGVTRSVNADLTTIAGTRVVEIQSDFSHSQIRPGTWEVLAWNTHLDGETATRRAAVQWQESPTHWAILTNGSLTRIGCAVDQAAQTWWFVCVLAQGPTPLPSPTSSPGSPSDSPTDPATAPPTTGTSPPTLPDTAMEAP